MTDSIIKKLTVDQYSELARIVFHAYPSPEKGSLEDCENWCKNEIEKGEGKLYGAFRDNQLLGGMIVYDFKMNLLSTAINAGGTGLVCVDFLHKKEKVAKDLINFFLNHYRSRNVNMALLYPFNIAFYKKNGIWIWRENISIPSTPSQFPQSMHKRWDCLFGKKGSRKGYRVLSEISSKNKRLNYQIELSME